ncbi:MAG: inositol monophosphatase [Patescibacteria group bacterium]
MSYDKELIFAKELAQEAGEIMHRYFKSEDIGTEWKEDNTPLTVADIAINDLVIDRVKAEFPSHAVLGEESSFENDGDFVWVVDPIDGTVPFALGMPFSTFSLGLVNKKDGQPVVGVLYDPQLDSLYSVVKDGGAFLNDKPLKVTTNTTLIRGCVSVLSGNTTDETQYLKQGTCVDLVRAQGATALSLQSQAYCGVRVASGELVGSIFGYGAPWDVAATSLMVQEAGGIVTDLYGNPRRYDQFAAGSIHAPNQEVLSKLIEIVSKSAP